MDFDSILCGKKHYGPILQTDADWYLMRCSFCNLIFKEPILPADKMEPKRSSKSCIQDCDWNVDVDNKKVTCKSCGYIGPLP